ncbi:uncharacterized protein PgNI_09539 [Pyricularia grisea]|uniref:ATP-dependent DNA helicase PIF1 n=1 Tax=Pyricularia grisea TaxID=148305 RepID=A0A6P8AS74_PYRGI|nr:uncharacterized protein PgNI_09539 [Pyricularia grisea]TLD04963.1 hypothetical protein PgNI_09539 [Pyricularia grisea]
MPASSAFVLLPPRGYATIYAATRCALHKKAFLPKAGLHRISSLAMLSRANRDFEAKRPSDPVAPKPLLARQLFPSSSPVQPQQSENVVEQLRRGVPAHPVALSSRTPNVPNKTNQQRTSGINGIGSGNRQSFATLCHNTESFREEPHIISLLDDENGAQKSQPTSSVFIADGDLSDDDNLDLDFEQPSALPTVPAHTGVSRQTVTATAQPSADAPPPSSLLSWSQSSPSHYVAPRLPSHDIQLKRKSEVVDSEPPVPVAKKRSLPKSWGRATSPSGGDRAGVSGYATPVVKSQSSKLPWDTTASAVKAQKKQLRDQLKRAPSTASHISLDDIENVVNDHVTATTKATKNSAVTLSNEQRHVKDLVCSRSQSVFFTGPAGTGKSVLMRAIIEDLKKKWKKDPDRLAVTASTGLAACNIGGMTLHSFAGIGLGKEDVTTLVKKIRRNPKAKNRWLRTKVLIIDEISMVDGDLFDKLSQIGRIIRNHGKAWGGIQLVITGDFFQLPPVPDGSDKRDIKFAFEAATWNTSIDHTIGLTEVFRQKDPAFANMLNEMRLGKISEKTVANFKSLERELRFDDGLEVTELFPTRSEVERSNNLRLAALKSKTYRYDAQDSGDPNFRDKLLQNMMAPQKLELRKGAQVMLIKNMDETLVNGSLGTVVGFMSETAASIGGISSHGGLDGEEEPISEDVRKRIKAFGRELESSSTDNKEYPVVTFHGADGTPRSLLMVPEEWKSELPTGEVQASRKQVPLILAWALSIHKAQGQTLERVKVDLGKIFEKGQAYVALSRATSQEGLQVLKFDKNKVMAHPRVVQFYNKLYSVETAMKAGGTKSASTPQPGAGASGSRSVTSSRGAVTGWAMSASG